jgi:hypothetical protein
MSYLDTSVLAAYYCPEARSAAIQRLLMSLRRPTISPLVEVELHCAVARKARTGNLEPASARRILGEFQSHVAESRFHVVPIRASEYGVARQWISDLAAPLRVLDALHLATAFAHDLPILTADKWLARSAAHFGVKCRLIS